MNNDTVFNGDQGPGTSNNKLDDDTSFDTADIAAEESIFIIESEEHQGLRLDKFLCLQFPDLSRSRLQQLIDQGNITVNSKQVKAGHKLRLKDKLEIDLPQNIESTVEPEQIELNIIYEDSELIVLNKRAGMVTHPGAGVSNGTLVNALLFHCRGNLSGIGGVLRPGIVHRLDKDTSGLIVVAKTNEAHQSLSSQIQARTAKRYYFALLEGLLPSNEGHVDQPIDRHPIKRKQMAIVQTGRPAKTNYRVLSQSHKFSFIEARLETGRTHQIRVHMASLNAPVVGDILYNRKSTGTIDKRHSLGLIGQALHAHYLSFSHPITGQLLEFEAPLPMDFQNLLETWELVPCIT
jgi:23S rRNA pseudouridine1911/1915/1917 synthase